MGKISWHSKIITMASQITSLTIVYSTVYSRHRSKKTSKLRVTGLCEGNSPVTGEFPAQRASNAENVSIWWRHHVSNSQFAIVSTHCFIPSLQNQWEITNLSPIMILLSQHVGEIARFYWCIVPTHPSNFKMLFCTNPVYNELYGLLLP